MTNNPLFDTILASGDITKRANSQVMDWTTTKSKVLTELKKRQAQSGYSCGMIIIDDATASPPTPEQKASMLRLYQDHLDSKILSAFRIIENAITGSISGSVLFTKAELTDELFVEKTWSQNHDHRRN